MPTRTIPVDIDDADALTVAREALKVADQTLAAVTKGFTDMAQEIEDLKAEVQAETEEDVLTAQTIADQAARIAELEAAVGAAEQAAADAAAGQAGAEQALTDALAEVRAQVDALKADNPAPEPDPNA